MKLEQASPKEGSNMSSWLFIPGNKPEMLNKIHSLNADYFIIDLEDAVPQAEKYRARKEVKEFLEKPLSKENIYIRINSYESKEFMHDIETVPLEKIQGLIISKCESLKEVEAIGELSELPLIPLIESLPGYNNLKEILSHPNVERVFFGSVDMSNDLKIRTKDYYNNPLLNEMRVQISLMSKLSGKENPIDSPYIQIDDLQNLQLECEYARKTGFGGKQAIHPKQSDTISSVFGYNEDEIQLAKEIIVRYEETDEKTFSHRNVMVDKPVYLAMKEIVKANELK